MQTANSKQIRFLLENSGAIAGIVLTPAQIQQFCRFYELVLHWNPRLHLTTITLPQDFYTRHLCEAIFAAQIIQPQIAQIFDLGTGLGIPGIPLAVLFPQKTITLIEANQKKAIFLKEAVSALSLQNCAVSAARFENIAIASPESCVISRALDDLGQLLPQIIQFSAQAEQIIFLGNSSLQTAVQRLLSNQWVVNTSVLPDSTARMLISFARST